MVLDKDTLSLERDKRKFTIHLASRPEAQAFVESIRSTLAGNRKALEQDYALALEGESQRWVLTLVPKDEAIQRCSSASRSAAAGTRCATSSTCRPTATARKSSIDPMSHARPRRACTAVPGGMRSSAVFLVWLALMLAGLVVVWNSRFTADMSFFLPSNPSAEQRALVEQLQDGSVSRLLMVSVGGGDEKQRAAVSRACARPWRPIRTFSRCRTARPGASRASATACWRTATR
jgi:hypothetical protein